MAYDGADITTGGDSADTLAGLGGGDVLYGLAGDDILYGYGPADTTAGSGLITAERIASGLASPLFASSAPGDPNRLFVVEKNSGQVRILDLATNTVSVTPFIDLPESALSADGERGLLGMAFHPDYAANGRFYLYLTAPGGDVEIREFTRSTTSPDVADPASNRLILTIEHSAASNHNGGWIGFGPDGYLYAAVGDGGGAGDPENDAQNKDSLLGKILRVDVDADAFPTDPSRNYALPSDNPFVNAPGADEIFAYGLRNPFRASFDAATGDLYIADVGQGRREEIDVAFAGGPKGLNFGWHVREGDLAYDVNTPGNPAATDPSLTAPVAVYDHTRPNGGFSVTGGYVYHGPGGLQGQYVFADFVTGNLWTLKIEGGVVVDYTLRTGQIRTDAGAVDQVASFAVDETGRLYTVGLDGEIHRLTPGEAAGDGSDILIGGAGRDRLYGGVGSDWLEGGDGDDLLAGGEGVNTLRGDAGFDVANYDGLTRSLYVDLAFGHYSDAFVWDGFASIEGVVGGYAGDILRGDAGANALYGNWGDDAVDGGAGDDLVNGGPGADWLVGGEGADRLFGGGGVDQLTGGTGADLFAPAGSSWTVLKDFSTSQDRITLDGQRFLYVLERDTDGDGAADDTQLAFAGGVVVVENVNGLSLDDWNGLVI